MIFFFLFSSLIKLHLIHTKTSLLAVGDFLMVPVAFSLWFLFSNEVT